MPKADLSVIITNKDKPQDQILACLESIRSQTVRPKEVIFVDDGSSDQRALAGTVSVILPKNVGVAKARDIGVKLSTSKLILFVDADDMLSPDFIEQCGKQIAKADIVYPNAVLFGEVEQNKLVETPEEITPDHLFKRKNHILVTSMMHKTVYEKLGGFREDLPIFEDWEFWMRAMLDGFKFAKANTFIWYRQSSRGRNSVSLDYRTDIYNKIIGDLKKYGRQKKTKTS